MCMIDDNIYKLGQTIGKREYEALPIKIKRSSVLSELNYWIG